MVALVCMLFLMHMRTSVVALISLPLGILGAFIIMRAQGLNANIMSLGGIAIAIGAMSDGAIVMTENFHKHLRRKTVAEDHWQIVIKSATEVGPALFFQPTHHYGQLFARICTPGRGGEAVLAAGFY